MTGMQKPKSLAADGLRPRVGWLCRREVALIALILVVFSGGRMASAQEEKNGSLIIRYVPPVADAPKVRVQAGTRAGDDDLPSLSALAPEHVGWTTREQPVLYWAQSAPARNRIQLTLIEPTAIDPVLMFTADRDAPAGIHRLDLAEHGVKLQVGKNYQWHVALVVDPENRSKDIVASGWIRRVENPEPERAANKSAEEACRLADKGLFYDAVQVLCEIVDEKPEDKTARELRRLLLKQVDVDLDKLMKPTPGEKE